MEPTVAPRHGVSVAVLAVVFVAGFFARGHMPWFGSFILMATPLVVVAGALPFMVRGYVLTEDAIFVKRLGWSTRLPLTNLKSVSGDVEALRRSIRIFGNGGLFSFTGEFWSRRLAASARSRRIPTGRSCCVIRSAQS